jgi:hypothetical protein
VLSMLRLCSLNIVQVYQGHLGISQLVCVLGGFQAWKSWNFIGVGSLCTHGVTLTFIDFKVVTSVRFKSSNTQILVWPIYNNLNQ